MTTKQATAATLRSARALVEAGWTQNSPARDRWGHKTHSSNPRACRFCPIGAIGRVRGGSSRDQWPAIDALALALRLDGTVDSVALWNDRPGRKKAQVLALFDAAIARLETTP